MNTADMNAADVNNVTLSVPDISCGHCKTSIESAIGELISVDTVDVSVEDRTVSIAFVDAVDLAGVSTAIEDQGYEIAPSA
jgi:copper chaperone